MHHATIMTDIIWYKISDFNLISNKTLPGRHLRKIAHFQIQVMSLGKFCHCNLHVCVCKKQYLHFGTRNIRWCPSIMCLMLCKPEHTMADLTGPNSTTGHDSDTANPAGLNGEGKTKLPGQLHSHRCHQVIPNRHPKIQKVLEYQQRPLETHADQQRPLETNGDQVRSAETIGDWGRSAQTPEDQGRPAVTPRDQVRHCRPAETPGDQGRPAGTSGDRDQQGPLEIETRRDPGDQARPLDTSRDPWRPRESTGDQQRLL